MDQNTNKPNFGFGAMAFWGGLAIICDIVSLIPGFGDALGTMFVGSFAYYLWKKGYGFLKPGRLAVEIVDSVLKMIPVIQELPIELLVGTIAIIGMIKFEEKTGIKLPTQGASGAITPSNVAGVRLPNTRTGNSYNASGSNTGTSGGQGRIINANMRPLNQDGIRAPISTKIYSQNNTSTGTNRPQNSSAQNAKNTNKGIDTNETLAA